MRLPWQILLGSALAFGFSCGSDPDVEADGEPEFQPKEIEQICRNSCALSARCELFRDDQTEEGCREGCPPYLTRRLERCPAYAGLKICLATLSCEEYDEYAAVINALEPDRFSAWDYPCKDANLQYLSECFRSEY